MSISDSNNRINLPAHQSRQQGMGLLAVMCVIAVVLFLGAFVFSVGPSYYRFFAVTKIAQDVVKDPKLMESKKRDIHTYIKQAYRTNDLWDFELENTLKLSRDSKGGYLISIDYEERNKFIGNIDIVTQFKKIVEQP